MAPFVRLSSLIALGFLYCSPATAQDNQLPAQPANSYCPHGICDDFYVELNKVRVAAKEADVLQITGTVRIDDPILKVDQLVFQPGGILEMPWRNFGGPVIIFAKRIRLIATSSAPALIRKSSKEKPQTMPVIYIDDWAKIKSSPGIDGAHGAYDGANGANGGPGGPGADMAKVEGVSGLMIIAGKVEVVAPAGDLKTPNLTIDWTGFRGGPGGTGKPGGRGGNGKPGLDARDGDLFNCDRGGQDGGNGGNGGPGGAGGKGADGGDSGGIAFVSDQQGLDVLTAATIKIEGGQPGDGGAGGPGGVPGSGSSGGDGSSHCGGGKFGKNGTPGLVGAPGQPGTGIGEKGQILTRNITDPLFAKLQLLK